QLELAVFPGETVAVVGASGSGKTTLLSILGGFTAPTAGRVFFAGADITDLPPARRPTATVFQDYALFPHLDVAGNVGFGLSVRGRPKQEIAKAVAAALELVGLPGFGARRIGQLSGGQRQRVALARALVTDPAILLLDEPLGALDLNLRRQMQDELRALQRREGRTFVHVTHDQEEAMALADLIVVMRAGRVEDAGPPERVYARPRTRFVATFMGESTILEARVENGSAETPLGRLPVSGGTGAAVAIRPEMLSLVPEPGSCPLGRIRIEERVFQGSFARLAGRVGTTRLVLKLPPDAAPAAGAEAELFLRPGGAVAVAD
ncbi:MAG: ABC transporter ATP-binding protein, partial [Geminicoccaceae bacterium]|nr:ABC transporter ATP-binding protein [Geminicoccaceae bacterium]